MVTRISAAELPVGSEVEIMIGGTWQHYVRRESVMESRFGQSSPPLQWWDGWFKLSGAEVDWYAERDRVRVLRTGPGSA